jgi:O-antigen/teichoic acid export membrane protein
MNSQRRQYWINLLSTFMSQAFTAASIIILTPILLTNLGEQLFGYYGILLNLILFCAIFDFGLNIGLLRRLIHEKEKASDLISTCFIFFCLIFPIAWGFLYALMELKWVLHTTQSVGIKNALIAGLLALLVTINMQATLFDIVLQSLNKIFVGKLIRIVKTIFEFGLVWWVSKQQSLILLIGVLVVVNILYVIGMYLIAKKAIFFELKFPTNFVAITRSHITYSCWYALSALAGVLVYNAQTVLMGNQLSTESIAKFLVIAKFYEVVRTGLANFTIILFPSIAMMEADGNWHNILLHFGKVFLRILALVVVTTVMTFTLGEYLFTIWSGFKDAESLEVFRLYTIMIMLLVLEHVALVFLSALKLNRLPTMVSVFQGILGLALSYLFMQNFGLKGALWGSLIALLSTSFLFNPAYLYISLRKNSAK